MRNGKNITTVIRMGFMDTLKSKLIEGRSESSVNLYMAKLQILNKNKPFRTLAFLNDYDSVMLYIESKKLNTQISYLTSILVALHHYSKFKLLKKRYEDVYDVKIKEKKKIDQSHEKSESQKESLIPIQELEEVRKQVREKAESYNDLEELSKSQYNSYLEHLVLELYTAIPPRRNQDYLQMYIEYDRPIELSNDKNYLVLKEKKFIFNKYKTAKVYGCVELDIPDELMSVIETYLCRHPFIGSDKGIPFLVNVKGNELDKLTGITKILNHIFGKKIGCSALRHIYVSDKFGDTIKEREEVANAMGHSTSTQNKYIKL